MLLPLAPFLLPLLPFEECETPLEEELFPLRSEEPNWERRADKGTSDTAWFNVAPVLEGWYLLTADLEDRHCRPPQACAS